MHIFSARLSRVACDVCVTRDTCDNTAVAHDVMTDSLCHAPLTLSGRTPGAILRYPLSGNIRAGDMLRPVHSEANNQPSKIFAWEIRI